MAGWKNDMGAILRLWDESRLLLDLRDSTITIIRGCHLIDPIRKLVESHDILDLTIDIQNRFPNEFPDVPEYDVGAMNRLKHLTSEVFVFYFPDLLQPDFEVYSLGVNRLMHSLHV